MGKVSHISNALVFLFFFCFFFTVDDKVFWGHMFLCKRERSVRIMNSEYIIKTKIVYAVLHMQMFLKRKLKQDRNVFFNEMVPWWLWGTTVWFHTKFISYFWKFFVCTVFLMLLVSTLRVTNSILPLLSVTSM